MNQILVIFPYWWNNTWVFDDEATGLVREPFVAGIPEMITEMVKGIPDARKGFRCLFSAEKFPGSQLELKRIEGSEPSYGGTWYQKVGTKEEGWLCPALFKYFTSAPPRLYARGEALALPSCDAKQVCTDFSCHEKSKFVEAPKTRPPKNVRTDVLGEYNGG